MRQFIFNAYLGMSNGKEKNGRFRPFFFSLYYLL